MGLEELQKICKTFQGVTEDVKWENHLCFNIGGKMFMITTPDHVPVSASFKVSDADFDLLTSRPGITPAQYLARYKWVHIDNIENLSKKEWIHYARYIMPHNPIN
jgi:predicted DNA-binding protein (MmcQ/YjbR family)